MKTRYAFLLVPLALASCGPAATVDTTGTTTMTEAPLATVGILPAGTRLEAALDGPIGLATATNGRTFTARVVEPILTTTGDIVIPAGAVIEGTVVGFAPPQAGKPAVIGVELERLTFGGPSYPLAARVVEVALGGLNGDLPLSVPDRAVTPTAISLIPGTIIEDPTTVYQEAELGLTPSTVISLGADPVTELPAGGRLTVEVLADVPLHPAVALAESSDI